HTERFRASMQGFADKNAGISGKKVTGNSSFLSVTRKCCQTLQRLLKAVHSDYAQTVGISARLGRVIPRHEKEVHSRSPCADRLLLDPADWPDRPVEQNLSCSGDLPAVVHVATQLLREVQ